MIQDTSAQDVKIQGTKPARAKWVWGIVITVAVALSAHAMISSPSASRSIERATVQIASVQRGDLIRGVVSTGRIVAANAPQLYSPEQGFVDLKVQAGDRVSNGHAVSRWRFARVGIEPAPHSLA